MLFKLGTLSDPYLISSSSKLVNRHPGQHRQIRSLRRVWCDIRMDSRTIPHPS